MAPKDKEATCGRTPKGIFSYKVMLFTLNNVGVAYQRAMQTIFDDMIHKKVKSYVDKMVVKFKKRVAHAQDLRLMCK